MCPNLESYSTVKRSTPSHSDNRLVSSSTKPAGDNIIGGKKEQQQQRSAKAPRCIGIFNRQHSPRSVHNKQCAMETAKIADSSVSTRGWQAIRSEASSYKLLAVCACLCIQADSYDVCILCLCAIFQCLEAL